MPSRSTALKLPPPPPLKLPSPSLKLPGDLFLIDPSPLPPSPPSPLPILSPSSPPRPRPLPALHLHLPPLPCHRRRCCSPPPLLLAAALLLPPPPLPAQSWSVSDPQEVLGALASAAHSRRESAHSHSRREPARPRHWGPESPPVASGSGAGQAAGCNWCLCPHPPLCCVLHLRFPSVSAPPPCLPAISLYTYML